MAVMFIMMFMVVLMKFLAIRVIEMTMIVIVISMRL